MKAFQVTALRGTENYATRMGGVTFEYDNGDSIRVLQISEHSHYIITESDGSALYIKHALLHIFKDSEIEIFNA